MARLTMDSEVEMLRRYASQAKLGVLEIGVYHGETSRELCRAAQGVPVFGIDPILPDANGKIGSAAVIESNIAQFPFYRFIQKLSHEAALGWQQPLDFIFVDGCHDYEAVKQDFEDWWPLLAEGGHMAFHDAMPGGVPGFAGTVGVGQFTGELIEQGYYMPEQVGTVRVFRK